VLHVASHTMAEVYAVAGDEEKQLQLADGTTATPAAPPSPAAASAAWEPPVPAVEPLAVCENLLTRCDSQLTRNEAADGSPHGGPTLLFRVAAAGGPLLGALLLHGTFFLPGVPAALEKRDPLLAAALLAGAALCCGLSLLHFELRRTTRTHADALLVRLGVGTQLVSKRADKRLRAGFKAMDPTLFTLRHFALLVPLLGTHAYSIATGAGCQEAAWQNRLSAAAGVCALMLALPAAGWVCSLRTATTLCAAKIEAVSSALERELQVKHL